MPQGIHNLIHYWTFSGHSNYFVPRAAAYDLITRGRSNWGAGSGYDYLEFDILFDNAVGNITFYAAGEVPIWHDSLYDYSTRYYNSTINVWHHIKIDLNEIIQS